MEKIRGLDRLPDSFRELFYYENGRLCAVCSKCKMTRQTGGINVILRKIEEGKFNGECRICRADSLVNARILTSEDVAGLEVTFDFDSQRRKGRHTVIDKVCLTCDERHTVRVSSVLATVNSGGKVEGQCVSCARPGWYMSSSGYIMIRTDGNPNSQANGYTPQHRLVMEADLGRPLTTEETVHHIDGNRSNNDISNLQLRKGQHGAGVKYACLDCGSHNVATVALD